SSRSPEAISCFLIRLMACSTASVGTARFSSERCMPVRSLRSSKGSRMPSFLITRGSSSSAPSNVVKRSPHAVHSRRRRTMSPSLASRESITRVSWVWQNGQRIAGQSVLLVYREAPAQLQHLTLDPLDHGLVADVVENVADPAGQ